MVNYVYRLAQVGSWVMINARWYKLTLTNLAYNFDRLIFHQRGATTG